MDTMLTKTASIFRFVALLAVTVSLQLDLGSLSSQVEAAQIGCGQTLGPGGRFTLDSDLGPCSGTVLTLNSAQLDLNGHIVSCSSFGTGVSITGSDSRIQNGTVTGCFPGVDAIGNGRHRIKGIIPFVGKQSLIPHSV